MYHLLPYSTPTKPSSSSSHPLRRRGEPTGDALSPPPAGFAACPSQAPRLRRALPAHSYSARRARLQGPGRLPQKRCTPPASEEFAPHAFPSAPSTVQESRIYLEGCSQGSEMADGDSSDFTFWKVSSEENDGQLGSPKTIPMASLLLEDAHVDSAETAKKDCLKANDSDKDRSGNSASGSTQDSNMKEPITQTSGGAESNVSSQAKPSFKKPAVRKKVPFEKGYSQMDWLKLTRTHPDLAGLKGQSNRRLISLEEVKQHKTGDCIWTVLKGRVYNIAPYMKFHPGGVDMLVKAAGKDCTALFNKYHAWVNAEFLLENCLVGYLDPNE